MVKCMPSVYCYSAYKPMRYSAYYGDADTFIAAIMLYILGYSFVYNGIVIIALLVEVMAGREVLGEPVQPEQFHCALLGISSIPSILRISLRDLHHHDGLHRH